MIRNQNQLQTAFDQVLSDGFDGYRFSELVDSCSGAAKLMLCRRIAEATGLKNRPDLIMILLEKVPGESSLLVEIERIVACLNAVDRQSLVKRLIQSERKTYILFAISTIARYRDVIFLPVLLELWESQEIDLQGAVVAALGAVGGDKTQRILMQCAGATRSSQLLVRILSELMKFPQSGKNNFYITFVNHPDRDVRLIAARGLNLSATVRQRRRLLRSVRRESDIGVIEVLYSVLLRFPNLAVARLLMRTAGQVESRQQRNLAIIYFRQLPDLLIYRVCKPEIRRKTANDVLAFCLTELSYIEHPGIHDMLRKIAIDETYAEEIRGAAIEGLVNHKNPETAAFLFDFFRANRDHFYLTYISAYALTRLWTDDHRPQILAFLVLDENRFAMELQTTLDFLLKGIISKKITLTTEIQDAVAKRAVSDNENIAVLAMKILSRSGDPPELKNFFPLLGRVASEEIKCALIDLLAAIAPAYPETIRGWLLDNALDSLQVDVIMTALKSTKGDADEMANLFLAILPIASSPIADGHAGALRELVNHLLADAAVRMVVGDRLSTSAPISVGDVIACSRYGNDDVIEEIATDFLIERLDAAGDDEFRASISLMARFTGAEARTRIMSLYHARYELRPFIAICVRNALASKSAVISK